MAEEKKGGLILFDRPDRQGLFTKIGKTLTAVSLGMQGKDPSSVFDDQPSLSQQFLQAQLAQLADPTGESSQAIAQNALGIGPRVKQQTVPNILGGSTTVENIENPNVKGAREGTEEFQKDKTKESLQANKTIKEQDRQIQRFAESFEELKKDFPDIGESTFSGFMERAFSGVQTKFGLNPKTDRYARRVKVFANKTARSVEGGRVTDQDRQVYADATFNALTAPTETNIGLAADSLVELMDQGGNIEKNVVGYISSDIDVLQNIGLETIRVGGDELRNNILKNIDKESLERLSNEQLKILAGE